MRADGRDGPAVRRKNGVYNLATPLAQLPFLRPGSAAACFSVNER